MLASLVAVAATVLVYVRAVDVPFVYDDLRLVDEHRALRDIADVRTLLLSNLSRPLVAVSYAIDRAIWGPTPFGFHVTNLALHALNVLLLFIVGYRVTSDGHERFPTDRGSPAAGAVALFAALLLAVHPIATEAVIYVTGRADLLATSFTLLAFLAARQWLTANRSRWLVVSATLWLCGMLANETALVFPFMVAGFGWIVSPARCCIEHRQGLRLLMISAALLMIGRLAFFLAIEYPAAVSLQWPLVATQLDVLRRYLVLIVAPHGQTIFHVVPAFSGWLDPRLWAALVVIVGLFFWIRLVRTRVPVAAWGMLWFLLALALPMVLILWDRGEPMAERRVYLAACGAFLAAGGLVGRLRTQLARRGRGLQWLGRFAFILVLLSLAGRTVERTEVWRSRVGLWTEASRLSPSHWVPALALGEALHDVGRHGEAIAAFDRSIGAHSSEPAAYSKLGVCLVEVGRLSDAEHVFSHLGRLDPRDAEAANGLATVALAAGDLSLARARFLHTLEFAPLNVEARTGLATVATLERDFAEVHQRCQEIALLAPRDPPADVCRPRAATGRLHPSLAPAESSR